MQLFIINSFVVSTAAALSRSQDASDAKEEENCYCCLTQIFPLVVDNNILLCLHKHLPPSCSCHNSSSSMRRRNCVNSLTQKHRLGSCKHFLLDVLTLFALQVLLANPSYALLPLSSMLGCPGGFGIKYYYKWDLSKCPIL